MSVENIIPITMPKWGLAMTEGKIVGWLVAEGEAISKGQEVLEIETSKITNVFESFDNGIMHKIVGEVEATLPCGALLGVIASGEVSDEEVNAFIQKFEEEFVPAETDGSDGGLPVSTIDVNGQNISYLAINEKGNETPVIMIHGFGGDGNNWLMNFDAYSSDHPLYVPDLIGHGASSKEVGDGTLNQLVEMILGFLSALKIEKVHIVGHSLGGAVAIAVADRLNKAVASLTSVAPLGLGEEVSSEFIEQYLTAERRRPVKKALQILVEDEALISGEMVENFQRYKRLEGAKDAMEKIANATMKGGKQSDNMISKLENLSCPRQVIWGENDRVISVEHSKNLNENITVHIIKDAGHLPHLEKAEEVNLLLRSLVQK